MTEEILNKKCDLCMEKIKAVDYKDVNSLRRFVSSYGKIIAKKRTGNCAKHQRMIASAIKKARFLALLPYVAQ